MITGACRRCGGDLYLEREIIGKGIYFECLQCGAEYRKGSYILKLVHEKSLTIPVMTHAQISCKNRGIITNKMIAKRPELKGIPA